MRWEGGDFIDQMQDDWADDREQERWLKELRTPETYCRCPICRDKVEHFDECPKNGCTQQITDFYNEVEEQA